MQRVNSLLFSAPIGAVIFTAPSITSPVSASPYPAVGDTITNAAGTASGVVLKVNGGAVMVAIRAGFTDFSYGDVVASLGRVVEVATQDVLTYVDTVYAQYANSPALISMLQSMTAAIDPYLTLDDFYNDVWNIDTAKSYGLAIWGRIVGVSNVLTVPVTHAGSTRTYAGFRESGAKGFGFAALYNGASATSGYTLTDDAFRMLIKLKAFANITRCTTAAMNQILSNLFAGQGKVYIQSYGNMQISVVFTFTPQPVSLALLKSSGAFPLPTGVNLNIMQIAGVSQFAEAGVGAGHPTFGFGSFFGGFS